jgi:hypothetical protein
MQSKETALSNLKTFRVLLTDAMRQEILAGQSLLLFLITQLNTVQGGYKLH